MYITLWPEFSNFVQNKNHEDFLPSKSAREFQIQIHTSNFSLNTIVYQFQPQNYFYQHNKSYFTSLEMNECLVIFGQNFENSGHSD